MKILHTADLHLNEGADKRWDALQKLVLLAREHEVQALVIAGDLFDHNVEAEKLRARLRSMLGSEEFHTLILPGNHDYNAYSSGLYFGEKVRVINSWKEAITLGDMKIWGLPYERLGGEQLVGRLQEMGELMDPGGYNILLFHGELLDAFFSRPDLGDEGDQRYMPVKLSYFAPLPIKYVLAGHFHTRYAGWQLPGEEGLFIYPGSPVAVTRREIGRRRANLLVAGQAPQEIALDTFCYEEIKITLDPFSLTDPLALLEERLKEIHPSSTIFLKIEGLFNSEAIGKNEEELAADLREKISGRLAAEPDENFIDVGRVLEDELFEQFNAVLAGTDYSPRLKERAKEMVIRAFRVVKACS